MTDQFNAMVAQDVEGKTQVALRQISLADLPDEDVLVQVAYSTLNYKDGLAVSGKGRICRTLPLICGIDLAGTVVESRSPDFSPGDQVLVNGFGLSETQNGGYSQFQRLKAEWLVKVPSAFTLEQTMAIGTAGYTSMLCILAIQDHGITPQDGPILVTGAAGGVGSVAVSLLAKLGYSVTASTGRIDETSDFLKTLGAKDVIARDKLSRDSKPMERETWAAAVDSVGGTTLATVLSQVKYEGIVAACGLAGGMSLPTSVAPFILRGVTLRGIDSVMASQERRQRAWDALADLTDLAALNDIYRVEPMTRLPELASEILAGQVKGRVVIDVNA
jgi:acrylyl-CoA reductase (NADPH)